MIAPVDAERRLVTVLYADLVGHTELVTRLDPEDWRAILQQYFAAMVQPIQRYGGTAEKFIGDAIFAVFGVPRAHEDDAARAVRAAVEMREALEHLNPAFARELGVPLGLRIAIATGEAVTPAEAGEDRLVVGDLTTLAERLQRAAPPNGIVLSERTHALVATLVEGELLGPLELKGFLEMQRAALLRRLLPGTQPAGAGLTAPLVNRERELADLLTAGERLRSGQGGIVFLIGEAGLGKSRLAAELRDRLGPGVRFLVGRCHEFTQSISHGVVLELLRVYLEIGELDPPGNARQQLAAALQRLFPTAVEEVQPALEHLLGLDTTAFAERTRGLGPEDVRSDLLRAVTAFWERAAESPTVLLVEDLHWVDAASASILTRLLDLTDRVPLMLLCAFRPERRSLAWDLRVIGERDYPHRYQEIRLGPLSPDETERLAAVLLERLTLPVDLKVSVARRAEGNPLYVEEVVRSLPQQSGVAGVARVPDTLQGVLQARLDALPQPTRRVLQAASVIGRTFPLRLLQVVVEINGDLQAHLSELQRRDFLREVQRIPEPSFAFKHVLLQEAAYQTLLRKERRGLHLRLARTLEEEAGGSGTLALLGHHYRQAEVWDKAFQYAVRAGDAALFLGGMRDALDQYDIALTIAAERPDAAADPALLFRAQLARGEALVFLGQYDDAERHLSALLTRYRAPQAQAQIDRGLGRLRSLQGDLRQARRHLERALRLLEANGDPQERAGAHRDLAHVLEMKRDYAGALDHAGRALTLAEAHALRTQLREVRRILFSIHFYAGDLAQSVRYAEETLTQALEDNDPLAISRSRIDLANVLLYKGDLGEALRQAGEAVELSGRLRLDVPLILAQTTLAQIYVEQGRVDEAAEIIHAVQDLVQRRRLGPRWHAAALRGRALVALARGEWAAAVEHLEKAKAQDERAGIARNLPKIHRLLAEAYLGLEDYPAARTHARAVKRLERGGGSIETPGALRVLGRIARERGTAKRAAALLEESRSLMAPRRGSGEYARTLVELARTAAGMGRREEARRLMEESLAIYRRLEAPPLVEVTEQLAGRLNVKEEGGDGS